MTVTPLPGFQLDVAFADGLRGRVDMSAFLRSAQVGATVFAQLCDPAFFAQVRVEDGAVVWPNGADLAPDSMYDVIAERGVWLVQ